MYYYGVSAAVHSKLNIVRSFLTQRTPFVKALLYLSMPTHHVEPATDPTSSFSRGGRHQYVSSNLSFKVPEHSHPFLGMSVVLLVEVDSIDLVGFLFMSTSVISLLHLNIG